MPLIVLTAIQPGNGAVGIDEHERLINHAAMTNLFLQQRADKIVETEHEINVTMPGLVTAAIKQLIELARSKKALVND